MSLSIPVIGIFLSVILLYFNVRKNEAVIYLGLFFFLISLYSLIQYVVLYSKSVVLVGVFFINVGFVTYLVGPMLYWYVRSVLTDDARLKRRDFLHFIPALIFLIVIFPYLLAPWQEKLVFANRIVNNANNLWMLNNELFPRILPAYIVFLSRPLLLLVYTIASLRLYIRFLRHSRKFRVVSTQGFMIKWLTILFLFLFILLLSHIGLILKVKYEGSILIFYTHSFLQVLSGIGLIGLLIAPFLFPGVLYGIPYIPVHVAHNERMNEEVIEYREHTNKPETTYEQVYLEQIQQNLERCMKEQLPFLKPDCNLPCLAKLLGIPAHHLLYYFKSVQQQTYNEYRNQKRVDYAKQLISEGKCSQFTLEAIGGMSGFTSRNTFFINFKKQEGVSPGDYAARFIK